MIYIKDFKTDFRALNHYIFGTGFTSNTLRRQNIANIQESKISSLLLLEIISMVYIIVYSADENSHK